MEVPLSIVLVSVSLFSVCSVKLSLFVLHSGELLYYASANSLRNVAEMWTRVRIDKIQQLYPIYVRSLSVCLFPSLWSRASARFVLLHWKEVDAFKKANTESLQTCYHTLLKWFADKEVATTLSLKLYFCLYLCSRATDVVYELCWEFGLIRAVRSGVRSKNLDLKPAGIFMSVEMIPSAPSACDVNTCLMSWNGVRNKTRSKIHLNDPYEPNEDIRRPVRLNW